jgi:hypothetical protein
VALASGRVPAAVSLAVTLPTRVGANRTVTLHDWRGGKAPRQVVPVIANSAAPGPDSLIVSAPLADPPEFVSVNVCEAVSPTATS